MHAHTHMHAHRPCVQNKYEWNINDGLSDIIAQVTQMVSEWLTDSLH